MDPTIFYKLLFPSPKGKKAIVIPAMYIVSAFMDMKTTIVTLAYTLYLFLLVYERKVLNLRRIAFASSALSLASALLRAPLFTLLSLLSVLYSPTWVSYLIASLPLLPLYPFSIILMTIYVYAVERYGSLRWGVAWIRAWMGDDYRLLDLLTYKEGRDVQNEGYLIAEKVAVVGSHFGLMRCAQGSLVPHFLMVKGVVPIKGCGSHERNPATLWEGFKVIKDVLNAKCANKTLKIKLEEDENWRILRINDEACIIYSKAGSDDIPCDFEERVNCLIADSHSNEGWEYPSPRTRVIKEWEVESVEVCEVKVRGENLCDERGFVIDLGEVRLIVISSNNLKRESSERLVKRGLWPVTIDDHSCAGTRIGRSHEAGEVMGFEVLRCQRFRTCGNKFKITYRASPVWIVSEGLSKSMLISLFSFIIVLLAFVSLALTF